MKEKLKKILKLLGLFPLFKFLFGWLPLNDFSGFWQSFKYYLYNHWITDFPNCKFRIFCLRHLLGIQIGKECFIHMGCFFEGKNIIIGNNVVIGRNCYLGGAGGKLIIKDNVSITAQVYIFCSTHIKDSTSFSCEYKDVVIENHAWIGARGMILPGVRIGKGSILGAASVATKDIPDYTVFAGSPAKEVGKRSDQLSYTLNYFPYFQ